MKNVVKITLAFTLVAMMASGCQQKTTVKKKKPSDSSSSGLGVGPGADSNSGSTTDTGTLDNCNGKYRYGARRCYYKNIPKITLNGAGTVAQGSTVSVIGPVLWSSRFSIPGYDQNSFSSDLTFNLRIRPEYSDAGELTLAGISCLEIPLPQ